MFHWAFPKVYFLVISIIFAQGVNLPIDVSQHSITITMEI